MPSDEPDMDADEFQSQNWDSFRLEARHRQAKPGKGKSFNLRIEILFV